MIWLLVVLKEESVCVLKGKQKCVRMYMCVSFPRVCYYNIYCMQYGCFGVAFVSKHNNGKCVLK